MPSIAIDPRFEEGAIVELKPCDGTNVVMTMPEKVTIFVEATVRGIEGGGHSLSIHQDGTLEYNSEAAEFSLVLPRAMADELYAAFEGLAGQPLEEAIEVEGHGEEDPTNVGGRKRRSRVQKQTRRTQRKRRHTIRK